ncbi:MAG: Ornithine cyclodeaminase [Ktedonobacterales bacterium]|jgi:ornithine cyclodeaminase/alanine dehydrogenase-like protein (mu-crystallin family)|nr:MAG: Ornithine cyclodeaminase [Ktedonobacterales bacterium]
MALVLREDDVRAVLSMPDTLDVLDAAFRHQATGNARNTPRSRIVLPEARGVLHLLSAYVPGQPGHPEQDGPGLLGFKAYTAFASGVRFVVLLYSGADGRLLALIEADLLGQMRTGAASGLATRYMARADARIASVIGTGGQARTQALALCAARPIARMYVYGRDEARRESFCAELTALTGVEMAPVASAEEAVREADIVTTATTARDAVLLGDWLKTGTHVNAMGSNWATRREVDAVTLERSSVVAVDSLEQAKIEAGDLLIPAARREFDFERAVELGQIVAGEIPGRTSAEQITFFKSLGIALEDVATAGRVYELARERGLGQELDILP